jgi:peptide chain release factor
VGRSPLAAFCLKFLKQLLYTFFVPAFPVSEKKVKALRERWKALGCSEGDIEESFLRGTGVELRHRPSGIRVRCAERRGQALNRFLARRILADELEARLQNKTRSIVKAEKLRELKGRTNRRGAAERLAQFTLRPLASPDQRPASKVLDKFLSQLEKMKEEETR